MKMFIAIRRDTAMEVLREGYFAPLEGTTQYAKTSETPGAALLAFQRNNKGAVPVAILEVLCVPYPPPGLTCKTLKDGGFHLSNWKTPTIPAEYLSVHLASPAVADATLEREVSVHRGCPRSMVDLAQEQVYAPSASEDLGLFIAIKCEDVDSVLTLGYRAAWRTYAPASGSPSSALQAFWRSNGSLAAGTVLQVVGGAENPPPGVRCKALKCGGYHLHSRSDPIIPAESLVRCSSQIGASSSSSQAPLQAPLALQFSRRPSSPREAARDTTVLPRANFGETDTARNDIGPHCLVENTFRGPLVHYSPRALGCHPRAEPFEKPPTRSCGPPQFPTVRVKSLHATSGDFFEPSPYISQGVVANRRLDSRFDDCVAVSRNAANGKLFDFCGCLKKN
jgi:hypothetical protein